MRVVFNRDSYSEAENEVLKWLVFPAELHFGYQTVPVRDMRCVWQQLLSVIAARIRMNDMVRAQVEQGQFPGISICTLADVPGAGGLFMRFNANQDGQQELGCWFALAEDVCAIRAQVAQWLRAFGFADHMICLEGKDLLTRLNEVVSARVEQGQSALQIALTDDLVEGFDNWYAPALSELRNKIDKASCETISGILNCTPYASKIVWFRIAYENWTGDNYQGVLENQEFGLGLSLTQQVRGQLRSVGGENGVLPFTDETFAEYVWFLSKANAGASRLKWGLRAAVSGSQDIDRYGLVSTLLNYSEDDSWHRGRDFRSFVDWFKTGGRPSDEGVEDWKAHIGKDFLTAFPCYDAANADCGYYLHWHKEGSLPPRPIIGISKVQLRNGYDRLEVQFSGVAQPMSLPASLFANDGTYSIPIEEAGVNAVVAKGGVGVQDCTLYPIQGEGILPGDDIVNGVFCRAVEGVRDNRRDWWTRLVGEDVVSNRKRELLVVVPGCVGALNVTEANGAEVPWIRCGQSNYYRDVDKTALVLSVVSRPQNDVKVRIKDWEIKFAAAAPIIDYGCPGWVLPVDDGMSVCRNGEVLKVLNVEDVVVDNGIQWWVKRGDGGAWENKGAGREICVDSLMDEGVRVIVECRIAGRHKRASVSLMRLPQSVVKYVGLGTDLPEGWNVVIRSTVEFARRGYEMVDVSRVNAAGINGETLVSFKRPLKNFTWWFEGENGVGVFDQEDFRLNVPSLVQTDSYIAFPDCFVDDEATVRIKVDDKTLDYGVARQMMIEYCGYRRIKIQDLVDKAYLEYEVGSCNEHSIYIGDKEIARFEFHLSSPCLSRCQEGGRVGVYFPNAETSARVAIFTDDVTSEMFADKSGAVCKDVMRGNEDFVEIMDFIEECRSRSPNGELFGAVVPAGHDDLSRERLGGRGVLKLSDNVNESNLPVPVDCSIKCWYWYNMTEKKEENQWLNKLCKSHPYYKSRVACFWRKPLVHSDPGAWWFENDNGLQDGQRNEVREYGDVEGKQFCIIGGNLLPESWRRLVSPPRQGSQAVRIKVKDLVRLATAKPGNLKLDENGRLLHDVKLCNGDVVCRVDLLGTRPLLCKSGAEWGVYLPKVTDVPPMVILYTDNPQSCYFPDGSQCKKSLSPGFNSIQAEIREFYATRDEVYAALFSNGAVDTKITSGMFLDREQCQTVCVIPRNAELPPPEWGDVLERYRDVIDNIDDVTTRAAGTAWERSRIWRMFQATQGIQYPGPGPHWLFEKFATGISPEGLKDSLRDLLVVGYNFLAEPELFFNLPLLLCIDGECSKDHNVEGQFGRCPAEILRTGRCANYFRDQHSADGDSGEGICSAALAWREYHCENIGRPTCKEADFSVDANRHDAFINFNIQASFNCYPYIRSVNGAAGRRVVFSNGQRMSSEEMRNAGFVGFRSNDEFRAFSESKVRQLRRNLIDYDVPQMCDGLNDNHKLGQILSLLQTMLQNERLTPFVRTMLCRWCNAICLNNDVQNCARIVTLAGIACAINLVVCYGGERPGLGYVNDVPQDWILSRNSNQYRLLNGVVYTAYFLRHYKEQRSGLWRLMMRAHIGALGLLQSFNIHAVNN